MKTLLAVLAVLIFATPAFAANLTKITMQPYSSASNVTCVIYGYNKMVFADSNGSHPMQNFVLDPDFTRSLALGTKSMASYSTTLGGKKVRGATFTCTVTGTNTMVKVKVGTNGSVSIPLTQEAFTFILKESM